RMVYSVIGFLIVMPVLMIKRAVINLKILNWDTLHFFIYLIILIVALSPIVLSVLFGIAVAGG
ncbi:MAG TPA: hypothetical protein PKJ42_07520, partial [Candidatus Goldiibacteriota bacterium]|nr:hypothetical protein [Candidatus Goldiibacteriota bacterium]